MFATLAGGYPWPAGLRPADALAAVLGAQAEAGFGLLADGRVHPASTRAADLVAAWRAAADAAALVAPEQPVKLAVGGPYAAGGTAGALEAAGALRVSLAALATAGCPLVEVHEPAATLPADEAGRGAFAAAHVALLEGLPSTLHASLAIVDGDATPLGREALFAAPYRSHLLDVLGGPDGWRLIATAPAERGIIVGVGDASGRGRTRLEEAAWAAGYAASTQGRGMARVGIAPSGSLAGLDPDRALEVLRLLGEAAQVIAEGGDALVSRLDPRAIDARTAALGQYRPPRRGHDPG
jgi:hypothetical protein